MSITRWKAADRERAVLAEQLAGRRDAGAGHRDVEAAHARGRGLDRGVDGGFARHVAAVIARRRAERRGGLAAGLVLDVEQRDLAAARDQPGRGRVAEARRTAADDCLDPIEIHGGPPGRQFTA